MARSLVLSVGVFVWALVESASAKPLVWWRFNECEVGQRTDRPGEAFVRNSAQGYEDRYWGKMYTNKGGGDATTAGRGQLVTDGSYNNRYDRAFPDGVKLYDPLSGRTFDNDRSVYFDGDKEAGDHKGSGQNSAIVLEDPDGELELQTFTIEMFVRSDEDASSTWRTFLSRNFDAANKKVSWAVRLNGNANVASSSWRVDVGGTGKDVSGGDRNLNFLSKKWHHLAVVVDAPKGTITTYCDYGNKTVTSLEAGTRIAYLRGQPIVFGSYPTVSYGQGRFWMDEIRISRGVLSPEQMLSKVSLGMALLLR